jgi:hypothetical protein
VRLGRFSRHRHARNHRIDCSNRLSGRGRPSVAVAASAALVHGCCCFSSLQTWPPPCGDNHGLTLAGAPTPGPYP